MFYLAVCSPFVLLEIGSARVTPFVVCDLSSFVHDELIARGMLNDFDNNQAHQIRCVHPLVTLLEKIDALHRRALNNEIEPASFVRHFEDAARIILAEKQLPPLIEYKNVKELAQEMIDQKQIAAMREDADAAFVLHDGPRTQAIQTAYTALNAMYWGERIDLGTACTEIRRWVGRNL